MQQRARGASTDAQWASIGRHRRMVRRLAFVLTAVCTLMNFGALGRLIAAILAGHAGSGKTLLTHNRRRIISGRNGLRKSAIFVCHCGLDQSP